MRNAAIKNVHGILGQSLSWPAQGPGGKIEGDEMDYVVPDGLLGTAFKYSTFTAGKPDAISSDRPVTTTRRLLLLDNAPRFATSRLSV